MISFLIIGFLAGAIAKGITPQNEDPGWISSFIIGIAGSFLGGFLLRTIHMRGLIGYGFFGKLIVATLGAVLFLYIYHRWLKNKIKLPI
ncbi:MAG: GlsB/YeaQ/YmgE family stress response membrane protein [Saprospiraceae bacterium]|nr:GlsB/YeaQ/YmgE family stress response membrane protein [Saprospiraceae bacterium]|tara:strand:+ start:2074 stop:2340 length:267 start_codon:yes stop_codon:yes gene_type:complete